MAKQCASVYRRRGRLFVATSSQTSGRYGLWIEAGPHDVVDITDGPHVIGERLDHALNASRQGLDYPADTRVLERPLLRLAGVKSWGTFARSAEHCYVERDGESVVIIPSIPDSGGFSRVKEKAVKLPLTYSREQLGQALLDAFAIE